MAARTMVTGALTGVAMALVLSLAVPAGAEDIRPSVSGDVQVALPGQALRPMRDGERLEAGSTVATGAASHAVLRFPDGQQVLLGAHTNLRVVNYRYDPAHAHGDRCEFELARGTARFITGLMGKRSPDAITLRTAQVAIAVRDADFSVAVLNPTYLSVRHGAVVASTAAGTMVFMEGVSGAMAHAAELPLVVSASALPEAVSASFADLAGVRYSP